MSNLVVTAVVESPVAKGRRWAAAAWDAALVACEGLPGCSVAEVADRMGVAQVQIERWRICSVRHVMPVAALLLLPAPLFAFMMTEIARARGMSLADLLEAPLPARKSTCRVYFIQAQGLSGPIKIGTTHDVPTRLKQLQTGQPWKLCLLHSIPGSREIEARLHDAFSYCRLEGEWFSPHRDLTALINDLKIKDVQEARGIK